ncbi:HutD/Ves family protein [Methylibium rhizosphaerae]|uniref:HutD/Ves family protein n=1 Tax=Methylibium rhizosphaerae TaxID=2570323 RepID=UPI0015E43D41|nr:HutD family protein [Methylibium rhizosphaerae]
MKPPLESVRLVRLADAAPVPWRNGGGLTRELLAWPAPHDWALRVSVADIDSDGPFSAYPGIERWFVVLEGEGVRLGHDGEAPLELGPRSEPHRFDGALGPACTLRNGPTRDLNLMVRRGRATGAFDAVLPGEPRCCAAGLHALYTTVPGTLQRDDGAQWPVPAHALAWWQAPPDGVWRFMPQQPPAGALRAWWMGAMPQQDTRTP